MRYIRRGTGYILSVRKNTASGVTLHVLCILKIHVYLWFYRCIGQHLNYLRVSVIPDHPDFVHLRDTDYPEWYTAFRDDFRSACNRFQLLNAGDELFEGYDTYPLYRELDKSHGINPYAKCDLKGIMCNIYKNASPSNNKHEQGAMIITMWDAVGRPGEIKFYEYSTWTYDYHVKVVDTLHKESKRLKVYTMPRFADDWYGFDWYCNMGAYYMCEQGLYQNAEQIEAGKTDAVFVNLQSISRLLP